MSREEQARFLARLVGIPLLETEVAEVGARFVSLMQELDRLTELDLAGIQPLAIFPEEEA